MVTALSASLTETQFAQYVDAIIADPDRRDELIDLLCEANPVYFERGDAAIVRMRGWILLALAKFGVDDDSLIFVLEELQSGVDAYLVAAAAKAMRAYSSPKASFAPLLLQAISNIRYREERISFEEYGEYGSDMANTSPMQELLVSLAWLGPQASTSRREIELLGRGAAALPQKFQADIERIISSLSVSGQTQASESCCSLPAGMRRLFMYPARSRHCRKAVAETVFQDHDGVRTTFAELFCGRPSIVAFFYTRCENPQKCSLTVTKLARIQQLLKARGLEDQIRTAAITYDPEYDDVRRIRAYGQNRGARLDANNRMLRTATSFESLQNFFGLGVNYVSSIVNRHRIEVFVLNSHGTITSTFQRLQWSEEDVIARARDCLSQRGTAEAGYRASAILGSLATMALAVFPKCPMCWSAYLSFFGVAGLETLPSTPWLVPLFVVLVLTNVASTGYRAWVTRRYWPALFVISGVATIFGLKIGTGWDQVMVPGLAVTLIGSMGSVLQPRPANRPR